MRSVRPALVIVTPLVLLAGCSDVDDLPDDDRFRTCLEAAGVDVDGVGEATERRDALSAPDALDCVADLESSDDQRAALGGVFTDEQLWPVLQEWIVTRDEAVDVVARETGGLLGAADGGGDEFSETWQAGQLEENLALAVHEHASGQPASYEAWLDDADAQQSVSESDPLSSGSQYLNWLEQPENGDQETAQEVRRLQDVLRAARKDV